MRETALQATSGVLVIGIGNPLRGDDAVGRMVARSIRKRHLSNVRALELDGEGVSLIEAWAGAQTVFIVDAVSSGAAPGTIHRFDATRKQLHRRVFQNSTHAIGLSEAVELAHALNRLPPRLIIYGIEGKCFSAGVRISTEVMEASSRVVDRILEESSL